MQPGRFAARSRPAERSPDCYSTHGVVASDHGESFGEQEAIAHGKRLTEQLRVPW